MREDEIYFAPLLPVILSEATQITYHHPYKKKKAQSLELP
jgi:hypothetical protein